MLEPNASTIAPKQAPPLPVVHAAKFPADDDIPGGLPSPGVPAGGGFDGGDGNFKKGRFNPAVIAVGVLAVVAFVVFLAFGMKKDAERISVEQAEATKKLLFTKPKAEQTPEWRKWAATEQSEELRAEALKQLAWAKDPEGVPLAAQALSSPSEPIQGMAAQALAEYGRPMAEGARDALLAALKTAGPGAKPQIGWALVVLGETRAFDDVMVLYRKGFLSKVQRLGGGVAFDPNKIVALVSLDKLASMAGDESDAVRQLVATVLSDNAEPKWTDILIKLVQDKDPEVARQAAPGLGKIGEKRAREPLIEALKTADKESRTKYFEALRDGIGTEGLVLALAAAPQDDEKGAWYFRKQILDMIHDVSDPTKGLNDPSGADALFQ
jgi:HEAT repeat protein